MQLTKIETRKDLANVLELEYRVLTYVLFVKKTENLYTTFHIPKKNGGFRKISAVDEKISGGPQLKYIQKKLVILLEEYINQIRKEYNINFNISHGFVPGRDIITNAEVHRNKRFVYHIDLNNFFDSFHFGRVKGFFEKNKYFRFSDIISTTLAQIVCYKGTLPQGASTSPIITNLICSILDYRILKIAKKYKLDFTRYADDLTFSTNQKSFNSYCGNFHNEIKSEIEKAGFKINESKTRLEYKDSRQKTTGIIVNEKLNVDRRYYKKTRAMAYNLYKNGAYYIDGEKGTLNQLDGRFAFINRLVRYNNILDDKKVKHNAYNLTTREEDYRKFLYYKIFFANSNPTIMTEGITDIKYIKAALKKYCNRYPNLITKDNKGKFQLKFNLFNRTPTLKYFFNLSESGADTMKNIYNLYVDKYNFPNYSSYFKNLTKQLHFSPFIFLFDNETETNRPLKKFMEYSHLKDDKKACLKTKYYTRIVDNLFIVTNPLVGERRECEIEDLFDEKVLKHEIRGKRFCPKDNFNTKSYYGKQIFSDYVIDNYQYINFERFIPMLNALDNVVTSHS